MQHPETESHTGEQPHDRIVAADLMTENPRTIRGDESVAEAIEALELLDVRHLPVVDEHNNLVGMISDRDLRPLQMSWDDEAPIRRARTPVVSLMSGSVVSVEPHTRVHEIVDLMLDHGIGAVPVVDGEGNVVGIVSYVDILRAVIVQR